MHKVEDMVIGLITVVMTNGIVNTVFSLNVESAWLQESKKG
jgi:hypothetical protein